jgi:hypothetical protein
MPEGLSQFKPKQKRIIRRAAKKYGIPSRVLFAQAHTESRNNMDAVSSAGARGAFQFMPGTAPSYDVKFDGRGAYRSQAFGAARYLNDLGYQQDPRKAIAGYAGGPGNPQFGYADQLLQTAEGYRGYAADALKGRPRRRGRGSTMTTTRTPGVDNSGLRQQMLQQYVLERHDPDALLSLGVGLKGAQDVPGSTVTRREEGAPGGKVRAGKSGSGDVMGMLRKAVAWDKAKVPYLWGGGHGSIAKPGQPVDCSGYVSAVLGLDSPQVSGNLAGWGKPGKGRNVTVYANSGHVLMSIRDPRNGKTRWFGTSKSNPGGGAGEIAPPDAGYLSNFTARHPG